MKCVLIVSSEQAFASALAAEALVGGWEPVVASDIRPTMRALYDRQPEAIILDLDPASPAKPWVIFSRIHEVCDLPIVVVACEETADARVDALQQGADDAVSSTCGPHEIMMRVRNQINHHAIAPASRTYTFCDSALTYDADLRQLTGNGTSIALTPIESKLLLRFLREPDRVLTCAELTKALWGEPHPDHSDAIKVYVHRLRAKIQSCSPTGSFIINNRTIGYRFR